MVNLAATLQLTGVGPFGSLPAQFLPGASPVSRLGLPVSFAAAFFALTSLAFADARQDFTLVNETGYELSELYISPSKANDWEEDVLGDDSLDDGDSKTIHFRNSGKTCMWDIKVVYAEDDSSTYWNDIDLCKISKVTLHYNKKTDKTTAEFD